MLTLLKNLYLLFLLSLCFYLPACLSTPSNEAESTTSNKGTKSATITIAESALQSGSRDSITATDDGEYLLSQQTIGVAVNVVLTLYNSGDVPAEKIKAFSLTAPLSYAGGSFPGTSGTCTKKIEPQTTCTIVVAFSPTKMGVNSGTLQLGYYNGKSTRTFEKVFKATGISIPAITSVSPSAGALAGGGTLTIHGTQIFNGALVTVGGNSCTVTAYYEPSTVSCVLPAHTAAAVNISVTNTDGESYTYTNGYTYQHAPTITSISPPWGSIAGGSTITITGTGFLSGAMVLIGGQSCATETVVSPTQITCVTPAHAVASVDVSVVNADGQTGPLVGGFSYSPPTITSLSSTTGSTSGFATVQINGTGFLEGAVVTFGGIPATLTALSSTQMTVMTPAHPSGSVDIVVTNSYDGQSGTASNAYTYSTTTNESWVTMSTVGVPSARERHQAIWTGSKMIVWGGTVSSGSIRNDGGIFDPLTNSWAATTTTNAPSAREYPEVAWTGSKMIIWGGGVRSALALNTGGLYDPETNTWTTLSTTNAPPLSEAGSSAWSGSKMYVWGGGSTSLGAHNEGGIYDPSTNSWTSLPTLGAPSPRSFAVAVYTGREFIVHAGSATVGGYVNDGAKYNPTTNTWTSISTTNAPFSGQYLRAFWTGSKMLIWGNNIGNGNTGFLYNPLSDTWSMTSTTNAPSERIQFMSLWTGSHLIVWGGRDAAVQFPNTGGIYNPETDQWQTMTTLNSPPGKTLRRGAVWTGSKMLLWGGDEYIGNVTNAGGIYTPPSNSAANSWTTITTTGAPSTRLNPAGAWTGSKLIIWGGQSGNTGGQYDPITNSWSSTSTLNAPANATSYYFNQAWTGSKLLIWGGASYNNNGALYDPVLDSWTAMTTTNAPAGRTGNAGVWTGSKFILWGGWNGLASILYGGQYDPDLNTWSLLSTVNAPPVHARGVGVWTGSKMFVWGGYGAPGSSDAGLYDPNTDAWTSLSTTNRPVEPTDAAGVWTGSKVLLWGGSDGANYLNSGILYDPHNDTWSTISTLGAPAPRNNHLMLWTGNKALVWGGSVTGAYFNSGGIYDPALDAWSATSTLGAPSTRWGFTLVWTGARALIWGGCAGAYGSCSDANTGGIYTPP